MHIAAVFESVELSKIFFEYIGILDSLDVKLDKLMKSELDAGLFALEQAKDSEKQEESLLLEARSKFYKAIFLEKNERLVCAYYGLAICHCALGDKINFHNTLRKIYNVEIEDTLEYIKQSAKEDFIDNNSMYNGYYMGILETLEGASNVVSLPIYRKLMSKKSKTDIYFDTRKNNLLALKSYIREYLGDNIDQ